MQLSVEPGNNKVVLVLVLVGTLGVILVPKKDTFKVEVLQEGI